MITSVEPGRGLARARNAALRLASGRCLLFLDDDCYAAPDYVEAWLHVFATSDLDFAAGRIELHAAEDAPMTIRTEAQPHRLTRGALLPQGYLQGANMACRREVAEAVGCFDPHFGPGAPYLSADDLEYFQRAADRGFKGGYEPGPAVRHHHGRSICEGPALARVYDISYGAVLLRTALTHPGAVIRSVTGRDGVSAPWHHKFYWDIRGEIRGSGLNATVARRLNRWCHITRGALHFAWNASRGRHRGYW
jgi:glycosyltransferase involved in cell wall biosynthesis